MDPTPFFNYARERQLVLLRRRAGQKPPWTTDQVIRNNRFCNVFREDDVTTIWLCQNVREKMKHRPELLLATVLFRWFNRMTTGEAIFTKDWSGGTVWNDFYNHYVRQGSGAVQALKDGILHFQPKGPYVTGAYCIIGTGHMPKLDGILDVFRQFCEEQRPFRTYDHVGDLLEIESWGWREVADYILANPGKVELETVWDWFRRYSRSGDFMAYEIVTDLAHSPGFLDRAPDRMSWANAGPGAIRGLNRLHDRKLEQQHTKTWTCQEMHEILVDSQHPAYWPQPPHPRGDVAFDRPQELGGFFSAEHWPAWDMRTVEHTLCEFDKYQRIPEGGKVKQVYRGG